MRRKAKQYSSAGIEKRDRNYGVVGDTNMYLQGAQQNSTKQSRSERQYSSGNDSADREYLPWSPGEYHDALVRSARAFTISNVKIGRASQKEHKEKKL